MVVVVVDEGEDQKYLLKDQNIKELLPSTSFSFILCLPSRRRVYDLHQLLYADHNMYRDSLSPLAISLNVNSGSP